MGRASVEACACHHSVGYGLIEFLRIASLRQSGIGPIGHSGISSLTAPYISSPIGHWSIGGPRQPGGTPCRLSGIFCQPSNGSSRDTCLGLNRVVLMILIVRLYEQ